MNIKEIARLSGVSRATVSRYLNQGYVSEEKKVRIQQVIDETGYVPSSQAQNLRTKKSNLIGVIIPKISSEAISRVVDGIGTQLSAEGYNIVLGSTDNKIEKEYEFFEIFKKNRVDGIIFSATFLKKKHFKLMEEVDVPIVVIGQEVDQYCCVFHDDFGASKALTASMIDNGCRNLACIAVTTEDKAAGEDRVNGFKEALKEKKVPFHKSLLAEGSFQMESGYEMMKKIYETDPGVDGVFCATDNIAIGAMTYLKEQKIQIGKQVHVAGIGDTRMADVVTPKLSTAHYYYKTSGMEAAKMLLELLEEKNAPVRKIKLGYQVIERES